MSVAVTTQTDWWEEADIRYRLIRGSLIFATFSAVEMGVGLYPGRLIREYIRYLLTEHASSTVKFQKKDTLVSYSMT